MAVEFSNAVVTHARQLLVLCVQLTARCFRSSSRPASDASSLYKQSGWTMNPMPSSSCMSPSRVTVHV